MDKDQVESSFEFAGSQTLSKGCGRRIGHNGGRCQTAHQIERTALSRAPKLAMKKV